MPRALFMDEDEWLAAVTELLSKPRALWRVLSQFKRPPTAAAVPVLREVLRVDDPHVQSSAIHLLAKVPGVAAEEAIASVLKAADSRSVAVAAMKLGWRRARHVLPALIDCVQERGSSLGAARATVLVAIAGLADARAQDVLSKALSDQNRDVRRSSARALGRIGTHKSREALEQAIHELSWWRGRYAR
jgi:HEAT repeat protein